MSDAAVMQTETRALWQALQPLRSVARYLMIGAHPDDEWNGFLAWLAYGRGVHTIYACSTRGEGGQSVLGPERGRALAAIRSCEMEKAAAEIDLAVRWIGAGPAYGVDDPIHDFGFSRSGVDTLRRWGKDRLVERLVTLIRTERPDALSPTFLDVPGQHGHHRAMTACTMLAATLAADPNFPSPHAVWQVLKVYLPAFSGAGGSYDDELPPPPETIRVDLGEVCAPLGASWAQWGERSRRFHASQGMGRDLPNGARPFRLHLASGVADDTRPMDGLAHSLGDLAGRLPAGASAAALHDAGAAIAEALAAFPERARVASCLHRALAALARVGVPDDCGDIGQRLALKRRQLGRAAAVALGIDGVLTVRNPLRAGGESALSVGVAGPARAVLHVPQAWRSIDRGNGRATLRIPPDAPPFGTLRDSYDPLGGSDIIALTMCWQHEGNEASCIIDPPERVCVAPCIEVSVTPQRVVRRQDSATPILLELSGTSAPASWPLRGARDGLVEILAAMGQEDLASAGDRLCQLETAHGSIAAVIEPASVRILRLPLEIPAGVRVGVAAGVSDETLFWLRQLDIDAEAVDDDTLAHGDLSRFTTMLIGIFGFGQRPALRAHRDRLMAWTHAGGSLVTMYHRPEDGWDDGRTPPLPLRPGRPSLRFRVTDPQAAITILRPDHPLLTTPNRIVASDWDGWVRERGLYFASTWDDAYVPLLELADPGETMLRGALLAAPVGHGRHVHVALALHHQFRALVPGAFRLLANLVA